MIKKFTLCDFSQLHAYYQARAEERKAMSKEDKAKVKAENEAILAEYGWCLIDGHKLVACMWTLHACRSV